MCKNYEKRVKDFITEMTNPSSQIVITDITEKVNNCRQELMNESQMQKPFIFKGYIDEQDRINDTVKYNKLLFNLPDYPEEKIKSKSKDKNIIDKDKETPPKINFHIKENKNENENENNKTIQNNQSLSLDATKTKNGKDPMKFSYKRRMSSVEKNQIKALIKRDSILQPQMKFTARTDLERVYDVLKGDYIKNNNEREIIERQLKHINLYNYKKPKELLKQDKSENFDEDLEVKIKEEKKESKDSKSIKNIKNIYGPSNVYYEARNNDKKTWARKDTLNLEAKGLFSSYHVKTHFKATEEIAGNKSGKKNLKETCFLLPHLLPKNHRYEKLNTDGNLYNNNNRTNKSVKYLKAFDYSKLEDTRKLFNFDEEYEKNDNNKNEEENYNGVNNPIFNNRKEDIDPHSLSVLSKLAFKPKINDDDLNLNDNNDFNLINNQKEKDYDKNKNTEGTNLNKIAKKILNECNVYSNKSKFNNSSHKTKGGKTMITKGLTIEEFENKYNF